MNDYQIRVTGTETAAALSQAFNAFFPYLKLMFFKSAHPAMAGSSKADLVSADTHTGSIAGFTRAASVTFQPQTTVAALEKEFKIACGLNVHVFRSSGDLWLETTTTDGMTLEAQNNLGREKSFPEQLPNARDIDYE